MYIYYISILHIYIDIYIHTHIYIPGTEIPGSLNTNTQRPNSEERATIGLLANTVREPANQNALLKTQSPCIPAKAAQNPRLGHSEYGKLYASTKILKYILF